MTTLTPCSIARALAVALTLIAVGVGTPAARAERAGVLVFAAASLKTALDAVNSAWQQDTGRRVTTSYAASPALARQLEQGAPAHVFISADLDWMDYVAGKGLIVPQSRLNLLGNRLVLIAPSDRAQPIEIAPGFDLAALLGDSRLAMASVDAVPAGKYGKAALQTLGIWSSIAGKLAQAQNVRAALLLVSRGEAPAGIVYRTDAAADRSVAIIGTFPESSHPPIVYPAALTARADASDAAAYLAYLRNPKSRSIFEAQGFAFLNHGPTN